MNCGTDLAPTDEQINAGLEQILETSLEDAKKRGGVCPLCGHSKQVPYSNRKTVLFALLLGCLLAGAVIAGIVYRSRHTQRNAVAEEAVARMGMSADVIRLIGAPITIEPGLQGEVRQDETGWKEVHLTIPIRGSLGVGIAHVVGGRGEGAWEFSTFEVEFASQHKKVDLISGRVVEYDANAYVDVHTQSAAVPEYSGTVAAAPRFDGKFPCVFATVGFGGANPQIGKCSTPAANNEPVDRFEADLRYGNFILRETDLFIGDVFEVPLTRTYNSNDWLGQNHVHAFGRNSNHPYDIAPLGARNPYSDQMIALEDGNFLSFDRISKGTGYADAVFQHTETATRFYKATQSWNGNGWTTKLADGSEILFPESYNAKNLAQGAPYEMRDAQGNKLALLRDPERNLLEIKTPHGHWIKFSYDDSARITRAEDDANHWAKYEYNSEGLLKSAILSSGRERHYQYEGILMTQISDESGHVLLRNWFRGGSLERQQFENGAICSYDYEWSPGQKYYTRVRVTLPDRSRREVSVGDSVPNYVKNSR